MYDLRDISSGHTRLVSEGSNSNCSNSTIFRTQCILTSTPQPSIGPFEPTDLTQGLRPRANNIDRTIICHPRPRMLISIFGPEIRQRGVIDHRQAVKNSHVRKRRRGCETLWTLFPIQGDSNPSGARLEGQPTAQPRRCTMPIESVEKDRR